ncbi:topoisomerase IV [uncultured Methanobrevibacter sp.]|uniref:topoisomerase IV n=1 Tax=uncultured Methanobrevibacter sp. TaxID=253161 RepID=UPI0025F6E5EA|nr:topoisomerase IV [uncultured Methanobrevibacter sp.]
MKDSKEKEHRISNLKSMINHVKDEDEPQPLDDLEEDSELIEYLNEDAVDFDKLEINDEFIYHPGDEDSNAVNLEENQIDEDFIIKAPKTEDIDESDEIQEVDEFGDDLVGDISENFDNVINARIGGKPILAIVSTVLGVILLIISSFIFQSRSDRVIDNVVAGETSFIFIIFLILGLLLLGYGIYRLFNISNPLSRMTYSIDSIEKDKDDDDKTETPKEKPSPKVIPKSKIPLDKESFKIGEFNRDDLKTTLKKPADSISKPKVKEDLEDIPPAKEKPDEKKGLTSEEIEDMEYEQVKLDTESIDDIFAEVEDIDDLPIISIDSKEEK